MFNADGSLSYQERATRGNGWCGINSVSTILLAALRAHSPITTHEGSLLRVELMNHPQFLQDIRNSILYLKKYDVAHAADAPNPDTITNYSSLKAYFQDPYFSSYTVQLSLVAQIFLIPLLRLARAPRPDLESLSAQKAVVLFQPLLTDQSDPSQRALELIQSQGYPMARVWLHVLESAHTAIEHSRHNFDESLSLDAKFQRAYSAIDNVSPQDDALARKEEREIELELTQALARLQQAPESSDLFANPQNLHHVFQPVIRRYHGPVMTNEGALSNIPFSVAELEGTAFPSEPRRQQCHSDWQSFLSAFDRAVALEDLTSPSLPKPPAQSEGLVGWFFSYMPSLGSSRCLDFFHGCAYAQWADIGELAPLLQILFPSQATDPIIVPEHYRRELESLENPKALVSIYNGGAHFDLMVKADLPEVYSAGAHPAICAFHQGLLEHSIPNTQKATGARLKKAARLQEQERRKLQGQLQKSQTPPPSLSIAKTPPQGTLDRRIERSENAPLLRPASQAQTKKNISLKRPTDDLSKARSKSRDIKQPASVSNSEASSDFDLVDTLVFGILVAFVFGSSGVILYALFPSLCLSILAYAAAAATALGSLLYNLFVASCTAISSLYTYAVAGLSATSSFASSCTSWSASLAAPAIPAPIAESPATSSLAIAAAAAASITTSPSEKNRP